MPEEFQNYRNFHSEIPRSSCGSGEEESLYSQTAEEEPARQEWNANHRAAPQPPSTLETRGEHEHIRARLVMPGKTSPVA